MRGWWLWARANHLVLAISAALLATIALWAFLAWRTRDGSSIDDTAFLLAFVVALSLSASIGLESSYDVCVERSIKSRRITLVGLQLIVVLFIGFLVFRHINGEFAFLAYLRDWLSFFGLSLLASFIFLAGQRGLFPLSLA